MKQENWNEFQISSLCLPAVVWTVLDVSNLYRNDAMNERIKQLAEQSGATVLTTHGVEGVVDGCYVIGPARLEKFAELIVKECAQRCEDVAIKHQVEETTYAAGKKAGAFECAADLKQHFGVEE